MREIIREVEGVLEKAGYDHCKCSGCFDIAARKKKKIMLLKTLGNVDSLQEEQAVNLRAAAGSLDATAAVVGERTRREDLENSIIYERFGLPAMSIETLEKVLFNDMPFVTKARGGLFIEISAEMLREKRENARMTQKELAIKAGTSKKNIYEHERQDKKASEGLAREIERVIGKVTSPASMPAVNAWVETKPRGRFETLVSEHLKSIGFGTSFVYYAPFNIVAKGLDITILSEAEEDGKRLQRISGEMKVFSATTKKPVIAVTRGKIELEIPSISEEDLKTYSEKDIKKLLKNA